jgi:hypothetical protein
MGLLYGRAGRAGRLNTKNAGFRPGQALRKLGEAGLAPGDDVLSLEAFRAVKASDRNVRHSGATSAALNHLRLALGLPRVDAAEMAQCDACHKWRYVTAGAARVARGDTVIKCSFPLSVL